MSCVPFEGVFAPLLPGDPGRIFVDLSSKASKAPSPLSLPLFLPLDPLFAAFFSNRASSLASALSSSSSSGFSARSNSSMRLA